MENELYKPDKKTTDRAWASMRGMLDAEMPERRRRRFIFWWFAGLTVLPLALVAGWLYWAAPGQAMPAPANKGMQQPAATPPRPAVPVADAQTPLQDISSEKQALVPAANSNIPVTIEKNPNKNTFKPTISALPTSIITNPLANNSSIPANSPETTAPTAPETAITIANTPARPAALSLLPVVESIPESSRDVAPLLFTCNVDPIQKPSKPASRPFSVGLMAGIQTRDFSGIDGLTTGLNADWKPFRHWGLRSGIGYRRERNNNYNVALTRSRFYSLTGIDVINDNSIPNTSDDTSTVFIQPSHLHYLQVPVKVFWQPFSFMRLSLGVQANRLMGASIANQYAYNEYTTTAESTKNVSTDYTAQSSEALESVLQDNLPRWNWDNCLEISFLTGKRKRLEFGLQGYFPFEPSNTNNSNIDAMVTNGGIADPVNSSRSRTNRFIATVNWRF